jgi:competence protein ComEC
MRRILYVLLVASFASASAQERLTERDSTLAIFFFDVGQGDATWIIVGGRKQILIDAGGSRLAIEQHLWENWLGDTLDLVIASHAHDDHIGGMPWIFDRYVVGAYMDNGIRHTTQTYLRTMFSVEREPGLTYLQATDRTVSLGQAKLRILPPPLTESSQNDNSVGMLLEFGNFRALFSGDAEEKEIGRWLRDNRIPRVHVLKASHHGASNGMTRELVERTKPSVVVISAGKRNSYGHPSPAVVQAWTRSGAEVVSTAVEGDIFIVAKMDGSHQIMRYKTLTRKLP